MEEVSHYQQLQEVCEMQPFINLVMHQAIYPRTQLIDKWQCLMKLCPLYSFI